MFICSECFCASSYVYLFVHMRALLKQEGEEVKELGRNYNSM